MAAAAEAAGVVGVGGGEGERDRSGLRRLAIDVYRPRWRCRTGLGGEMADACVRALWMIFLTVSARGRIGESSWDCAIVDCSCRLQLWMDAVQLMACSGSHYRHHRGQSIMAEGGWRGRGRFGVRGDGREEQKSSSAAEQKSRSAEESERANEHEF